MKIVGGRPSAVGGRISIGGPLTGAAGLESGMKMGDGQPPAVGGRIFKEQHMGSRVSLVIAVILAFGTLISRIAPPIASTLKPLPAGSVVINEVAWMGTSASPADEWIELYNTTDQDIDLTGWTLVADDGSPNISLSGTIPAGGYLLLERTDENTVSDIDADLIYTGALKNTGEILRLQDASGTVIDTANGDGGPWPAGNNITKSSMERIDPTAPDGDANWGTNDGVTRNGLDANGDPINGTPKQRNSVASLLSPTPTVTFTPTLTPTATWTPATTSTPTATPPPAWNAITLNEYLPAPRYVDWDGDGTPGPDDEWIELYNRDLTVVDLGGWQLDDIADGGTAPYTIPPGTTILPHGFRVFFKRETGIALNNDGDTVRLIRPDGVVAEQHTYTGARYDQSYAKTVDGGDTWTTDDSPSPGEPNSPPTATPTSSSTPTPSPTATVTASATRTSTAFPTLTSTPTPPTVYPSGAVVINEVVTDPQQDWNDSAGGNGVPFDAVPGDGVVSSTDEWIELLNVTECSLDLTGWSLVMIDTSPATEILGEGKAVLRFSAGGSLTDFRPGERLVVGNPKGALNNDVYIELRDASGHLVDDVEIGDDPEGDGPDGAPQIGQDGNALTVFNEAIARIPDGIDSDDDIADFAKRPATIGSDNGLPVVGRQVYLPVLNALDNENRCRSRIDIQNVGEHATKALVLFWATPSACPPQCSGPAGIVCSGLLRPGATWHVLPSQMPPGTVSAAVFSAFAEPHPAFEDGAELFADALCEAVSERILDRCERYRAFQIAFTGEGIWNAGRSRPRFDFSAFPGAPLAVRVTRQCVVTGEEAIWGSYAGLRESELGRFDPTFDGFAFYVPLVHGEAAGWNTYLYVQNASVECTGIELWFRSRDECRRTVICEIPALAPGETTSFDVGACVGPGFVGSVWLRTSARIAVAVDTVADGMLTTFQGQPIPLATSMVAQAAECEPGRRNPEALLSRSKANYGPLIYREFQGWETHIQVQNLSSTVSARVKVYFLDRAGNTISTVVDWICPRGSQTFFLPVINDLPGRWVGQVRVESQMWWSPGNPAVEPPDIASVAQLIRYGDTARTQVLEAMAYNLFPEGQAFGWQLGPEGQIPGPGAVGQIAIPDLHRDADDWGRITEIAIQNTVPIPGFTDIAVFLFDQNGLLDIVCQKLDARQVEYLGLDAWGYVNPGFSGSAVISAVAWEHVESNSGRNLVGLAAVAVERRQALRGAEVPGDVSTATRGVPMFEKVALPEARCP